MPKLNAAAWAIWSITIVSQPVIAFALYRTGRWRTWKAFFSYMVFLSAQSFVLLALVLLHRGAAYFWTYWVGCLIRYTFEFLLIAEIADQVIGFTPRLRAAVRGTLYAFSPSAITVSAALALRTHAKLHMLFLNIVAGVDRAASLAWSMVFLAMAFSIAILNKKWDREPMGVASGFAVQLFGNLLYAWAFSAFGFAELLTVSNLKCLVYLFALGFWATTFLRQIEQSVPEGTIRGLHLSIESHMEALRKVKLLDANGSVRVRGGGSGLLSVGSVDDLAEAATVGESGGSASQVRE